MSNSRMFKSLLISAFLMSILSFSHAEVILTFLSSPIVVGCGKPGITEELSIYREAAINEPYAVELGWTPNGTGLHGYRYRTYYRQVRCTGLNFEPHNGTGLGSNRAGFKVNIIRDGNLQDGYTYHEDILTYIDDTLCGEHEKE